MTSQLNVFQQAIGLAVPTWSARPTPPATPLLGRYCRLEPLNVDYHAQALYEAFSAAPDPRDWTYMSVGPFADEPAYREFAQQAASSVDPLHYAVIDLASGLAVGTFALMRIDTSNGVLEVGFVCFSHRLKRTRIATEAQYLLMRRVFDELGYRRYEWKCDSLNAPSRAAAQRLGFTFEGVFRQAVVYKGRCRDTAWFSMLDHEWPVLRVAYERWLNPDNFDAQGRQQHTLANEMARARTLHQGSSAG